MATHSSTESEDQIHELSLDPRENLDPSCIVAGIIIFITMDFVPVLFRKQDQARRLHWRSTQLSSVSADKV